MANSGAYLFEAYLNLIANGKTAAQAERTLAELFPTQAAMLPAILNNRGDIAAAERQVVNDQIRAMAGRGRVTQEVDDAAIRGQRR